MESIAQTPKDGPVPAPMGYIPIKAGHPRWNVVMILVLIAAVLAIALIEAQRLSLGS